MISEIQSFLDTPTERNDAKDDGYYPIKELAKNKKNTANSPSE
jgi:hypothetical protein